MKRLLLFRHAKASQDMAGGDHSRPLAPRGRRNAPAMGKVMRKAGYVPDYVLCSDAARTRETWKLAAPELKAEPQIAFIDVLYLASGKMIIKEAQQIPDKAGVAMIIGHNPGLEDCATALLCHAADDEEHARRMELSAKFPTGALAVIDCDIESWRDLAPACGALTAFIKPRDLD